MQSHQSARLLSERGIGTGPRRRTELINCGRAHGRRGLHVLLRLVRPPAEAHNFPDRVGTGVYRKAFLDVAVD